MWHGERGGRKEGVINQEILLRGTSDIIKVQDENLCIAMHWLKGMIYSSAACIVILTFEFK